MAEKSLNQQIFQAIYHKDTKKFISIYENNPNMDSKEIFFAFINSAADNCFDILKYILDKNPKLINKEKFEELQHLEEAFFNACSCGHYDVTKFLMDKYDINPAEHLNQASYMAYQADSELLLDLFWQDQRVKDSLKNDHYYLYKQHKLKDLQQKVQEF